MDDSLPDDLAMYGNNPDAPLPQGNELSGVEVAPISQNFPEHVIMVLQESFIQQRGMETKELMFIFKSGNS